MAGRPQGRESRDVYVPFRTTISGARILDLARGKQSRSTYLRNLIAEDAKKKGLLT